MKIPLKRFRRSKAKAKTKSNVVVYVSAGGYLTTSLREKRVLENDKPLDILERIVLVRPKIRTAAATRSAIRKAVRELKLQSSEA